MSLLTPFLKLFKWNTEDTEDLEQPFDIKKAMNENWDKLDTKAQEQEKKISDIADNIEDIQTKDTEQDKLIQKLQSNMINESTEEATSLYVEDASNVPAVLQIEGNHYQETQEGTDNLAVLNEGSITQDGITVSVENGVASFSGANTSDAVTYITVGTAYLYAGQIYYMSAERQQTSGNSGLSIKLGSLVKWFTVGQEVVFECTETGEYEVRVSFGVSTVANLGTLKYLISKTSGAEWTQGKKAIPSVEYPSPIKIVGDNINILPNNFTSKTENGLDCTVNSNKSIHVVGTATATTHLILVGSVGTGTAEEVLKFKANKQYKNISNVDVLYQKTDNSYGRLLKDTEFTFENDTSIRGLYLQINSGETVDETYYPKIVEYYEGIDESYSPYNMGSVKITKVNKNMFILPASNLLGIEVAPQEDGAYKLNGTSSTSWAYRNGEPFWIFPGKYTIFTEGLEGLISAVFGIRTEDNWKAEINVGIKEYTFTVNEKMKVRPYFTCSSSAIFNNNTVKVQLEKSKVKTSWAKHEEESYILPIQQKMLKTDKFDLLNNKEIHGFKIKIFDGTETISMTSNGNSFSYNALDILRETNTSKVPQLFSNCYIASSWNDRNTNNKANTIAIYNYIIGFDKGEFSTVEEFKAELIKRYNEGNPIYVIYPLAEAIKLDLTKEQKEVLQQLNALDLYKGTNNIYTEQDLALLQLDYTADTKMYIDNKIANTNAQILNVAGGN